MTRAVRDTLRKEQGPATALQVRKRGKLTYYRAGDRSVLSAIETEAEVAGNLTIYFAGLTGGYSATGVLGRDLLATMNPHRATPLVFACRETWLRGPDHVASYEFYSVAILQRAGAGAS